MLGCIVFVVILLKPFIVDNLEVVKCGFLSHRFVYFFSVQDFEVFNAANDKVERNVVVTIDGVHDRRFLQVKFFERRQFIQLSNVSIRCDTSCFH